ncbi:MAG: hypothetical protein H7840_08435 [Alphaproteobacteria bacterium]
MPTPKEFLEGVIQPALVAIDRNSVAAQQLLLGTAIQESALKHLEQIGGGPALGYFQMETVTHDDIWETYLKFRDDLADKVRAVAGITSGEPSSQLLKTNHEYAAAMARIRYARVKAALPQAGDIEGMANYWKQHYNTAGGAGKPEEFINKWKSSGAGALFAAMV